jgi:hypothetical protein
MNLPAPATSLPSPHQLQEMEPFLSAQKVRILLASFKGGRKIDYNTLINLVKKEGLPKHSDPFGSGRWCFLRSEIEGWYQARLQGGKTPLRSPGRPRKVAQ